MDRIAEAAELALQNSDFGPEVKDHLQKVIDRNRELKAEVERLGGLLDEVEKLHQPLRRLAKWIDPQEFEIVDHLYELDAILAKRKGGGDE